MDADGIITTVAGNGTSGYSGDGGPAIEASLNRPAEVVLDASGNLYIADSWNQCIRKVDTNGIITTVAGSGTWGYDGDGGLATEAQFRYPQGITVDLKGNLYIADTSNNCIRMVDTSGIIITIAGNGSKGYSGDGGLSTEAQLDGPKGVTLDNTRQSLHSRLAQSRDSKSRHKWNYHHICRE